MDVVDNLDLDLERSPATSAHKVDWRIVAGADQIAAIPTVPTSKTDPSLQDVASRRAVITRQ